MDGYGPLTMCLKVVLNSAGCINLFFADIDLEPRNETTGECQDFIEVMAVRKSLKGKQSLCQLHLVYLCIQHKSKTATHPVSVLVPIPLVLFAGAMVHPYGNVLLPLFT